MICSTSRAESIPGDLRHSTVFILFCLDWNAGFLVHSTYHHFSVTLQGLNSASTGPVASQHTGALTCTWLGERSATCSVSSMTRFGFVCWEIFWLSWLICVITARWYHCGLQAERNIPDKWNREGCDTYWWLSIVWFIKLENTYSASGLFACFVLP